MFPDVNTVIIAGLQDKGELEKDVVLDDFLGTYSSKIIPIKIVFTEQNNTVLNLEINRTAKIDSRSLAEKDLFESK